MRLRRGCLLQFFGCWRPLLLQDLLRAGAEIEVCDGYLPLLWPSAPSPTNQSLNGKIEIERPATALDRIVGDDDVRGKTI